MRWSLVFFGSLVLALGACGGSSAASQSPGDLRLAKRIAPIAADLGSKWRRESSAAAHARSVTCPQGTTACTYRFFVLPGDPAAVPRGTALVQMFASAARARSAYTAARRKASLTRKIDNSGMQQTISLRSQQSFAAGGGHATLLVFSIKVTSPVHMTEISREILLQQGRGLLDLTLKPGRTVPFTRTTQRLIARMQPAHT
jgi:hypothetical protein